jgi:hypothetical protein
VIGNLVNLAHAHGPNLSHHTDGGSIQPNGGTAMAKGQMKSNKEAKKPKAAAKPKGPAAAAPAPAKGAAKAGKKG